jgi:uncharacterized protein (TIGR02270 family)
MSTVDAEIFERYAGEAAFLWTLRDAAVRDPLHDLKSLCELDERLEAHLDGLKLAGDAGWKICEDALEDGRAGEVFAAMFVAIDRQDLRGVARVLDVGGESRELARAIVSALSWAPIDGVRRILAGLLYPRCSPALHYLGIAAGAAHRADLGPALGYAVVAREPRLKARALRAVGELGRADLLPELKSELDADDEGCRFSAAWSAALLGEPKAIPVLLELADAGGPHAIRAADMAMRRMDPAVAAAWLRARSRPSDRARVALTGAAALGDTSLVPWLIDWMATPETARAAGAALSLITGVDIAAEKLKTRPPDGFRAGPSDDPDDEDVAMDPDWNLPWPHVDAVQDWWSRRKADFPAGTRHLSGKPMGIEWLRRVLHDGTQPARAAAAIELSIRLRGRAVFEVRAAGKRQRRVLGCE